MKENERQDEQIVLQPEKANPVSGMDPRTPKVKKAKRVAEIPAYRNTVRDAYRLDDGTEVAIFYPQAIRSFDEEKQSFEPVEKTIAEAEGGTHFMGGKNGFGVRFNKEAESDELFDISHGKHRVTVFTKRNQKRKNKMCSIRNGETDTLVVSNAQTGGAELAHVSYTYDAFDNMTEIARGDGMKYALAYNAFHNLESIGVQGKNEKLVAYTYKNGNGRLKQVTYANGHTMKATYNSIGQMVAEKWYDGENLIAHYRYAYDGQGNIVRSLDFMGEREYNYQYEEGRITRATEKKITVNNDGMIVSKTLLNTVLYLYDAEGTLTRKRIMPAGGVAQDIWYQEADDNNAVVKFQIPDPTEQDPDRKRTVTAHSKSDTFGRKVFDEVQLGAGTVSRKFSYHDGEVTQEHKDNIKVKSGATTQLVSKIEFFDGRTLSYEYDAEERITKMTDSVDGITAYTYDALGQLVTETHQAIGEETATTVNTMTYDGYGKIKTKNGVEYTYGDGVWKDLLTKVGEQTITYDAQGTPISYLGHTLTWEKGRQLKSFDGNTYTYNANGIRTSKTIDGVRHDYVLDGAKILWETWTENEVDNTIIPLYDNEDSVCGICFNGEYFYFQKNLQGDIISITDKDATEVAKYTYDAWGICTIVSDTSACSIAAINPYRYRGYYYDNEIGMYYLQSRYYNARTGRFVNIDAFISTYRGTTGCNLLAYCLSNPANAIDPDGKDAIWLQDRTLVGGLGHSGLLIQDKKGKWWHYYWGANRDGFSGKSGRGNTVMRYEGSINLSAINSFYMKYYNGNKYEEMLRFKGNFSKSVTYMNKILNRWYFVWGYNCVQTSLDILRRGTFAKYDVEYKMLLLKIRKATVPNAIFDRIVRFTTAVDRWERSPWYVKIFLDSPAEVLGWI